MLKNPVYPGGEENRWIHAFNQKCYHEVKCNNLIKDLNFSQ